MSMTGVSVISSQGAGPSAEEASRPGSHVRSAAVVAT
jgi:hypothetical protein